jgi:hypothetical protein
VAADKRPTGEERRAALLLLLDAELDPRYGWRSSSVREEIARLRRFRLPWDAASATAALDLVRRRGPEFAPRYDSEGVAVALAAAESVVKQGGADARLVEALDLFDGWLELLRHPGLAESRRAVLRIRAAMTPAAFLDLSPIATGDAWGRAALATARDLSPDAIAPLVRLLGDLGSRSPSQRWRREVAAAVSPPEAEVLVRRWLDAAVQILRAGGRLPVAERNVDLLRATVHASRSVADLAPAWEELVVLGAETDGAMGVRGLRVASAATEELGARGSAAEVAALERLLVEVRHRTVIRQIGAALGRDDDAAERADAVRRQKRREVRAKASPEPRLLRAEQDRMLRATVAPVLRAHGFRGGVRTWRRHHADRTDVVAFHSADAQLSYDYGTLYRVAHPDLDPAKVQDYHLDVRLFERAAATEQVLRRVAERLEQVILPFLDTLGQPDLALSLLRTGAGKPAGASSMTSGAASPGGRALIAALERGSGAGVEP